PQLARFVLVSGDRDMIEIARCLQKHGREVVVIAPEWSASADLSDVCDRFVPFAVVQQMAGLVLASRPAHAEQAHAALVPADRTLAGLRSSVREILALEHGGPWRIAALHDELVARHG